MASFHDPDVSLPVVRRRIADQLLDFLFTVGEALLTRGRSFSWGEDRAEQQAFWSAARRLRKAGLVVTHDVGGRRPVLVLTEAGKSRARDECRPERWWNRRWNGLWYVLAYDVPEKDRCDRETLRGFLARLRMGCLQKSVWVTPRDIRPEYADLTTAARIGRYAFLLESRTVLGQESREIVDKAWNWDRLDRMQEWYVRACGDSLGRVTSGRLEAADLVTLGREEMSAYLAVMCDDPLLPRELWPQGYYGPKVYDLHTEFQRAVADNI